MIQSILLPVEGIEFSKRAYKIALDIAQKYGAYVTILHMETKPSYVPAEPIKAKTPKKGNVSEFKQAVRKRGKLNIANSAKAYFGAHGIKAEVIVVYSEPVQTILEYADSGKYDVVIMCNCEDSFIRKFTMDITIKRIIAKSQIPVLVVQSSSYKIIDMEEERERRIENDIK